MTMTASGNDEMQGDRAIDPTALAISAQSTLCVRTRDVVVSIIPKNGCTALRHSIAVADGLVPDPDDIGWMTHRPTRRRLIATPREIATAGYTFVILRCPFSRIASAYLDKAVSESKTFKPMRARLHAEDEPITFRSFVTALEDQTVRYSNIHWRPQAAFLIYQTYDDYFQFEDFSRMTRTVSAKAGLTILETRHLALHGQERYIPVDGAFADAPLTTLQRMRSEGRSPSPISLYDAALFEQIGRLYAEDRAGYIARFGEASLLYNRGPPTPSG